MSTATALITVEPANIASMSAAELNRARAALAQRLETLAPRAEVRRVIQRLILSYPQTAAPESPETYIAALETAGSRYALDVLVAGCGHVLATCKHRPAVAELVKACEVELIERHGLLSRFDSRLGDLARAEAEVLAARAAKAEAEKRVAKRVEYQRQTEAAIRARFGAAVPAWFTIARAWRGTALARGSLDFERRAAAGDGASFVAVRRAALYGYTVELVEARGLAESRLWRMAKALANGDDKAAAALIETASSAIAGNPAISASATEAAPDAPLWPSQRDRIPGMVNAALSERATLRAARAEGLAKAEGATA